MVCCSCFGLRPKGNMKQKKKQKQKQNQIQKLNDESSPTSAIPERAVSEEEDGKVFTYRELATATNNFKVENMVGRGGFGAVYKGTLESTGQEVAVKMLDTSSKQGDKEFLAEVLMLSVVRHEHLVRLIGYCAEGDQRLLVYEYMPLGSVEDHIHSSRKVLDWSTRMKIAAGAAKGLEHLHNVAEPPVIYRDLKTANILLDHGYKAKLSDFGFAKFAPTDGDVSHVSTDVMGTLGYCAPEYAVSGRVTKKSDIYSFGVVMLELISGRNAIMDSCTGPYASLVHWALPLFNQNKIYDIVDPKLTIEGGYMEKTLKKALEVAILCLREEANKRPTISEVVIALNYIFQCTKGKKKIKRGGSERGRGRGDSGKKGGTESSPKETPRIMNDNNEIEEEDEREKRKRDVADAKIWAELCRERLKKEEH